MCTAAPAGTWEIEFARLDEMAAACTDYAALLRIAQRVVAERALYATDERAMALFKTLIGRKFIMASQLGLLLAALAVPTRPLGGDFVRLLVAVIIDPWNTPGAPPVAFADVRALSVPELRGALLKVRLHVFSKAH